ASRFVAREWKNFNHAFCSSLSTICFRSRVARNVCSSRLFSTLGPRPILPAGGSPGHESQTGIRQFQFHVVAGDRTRRTQSATSPQPVPPKPASRTVVKLTGAEGGSFPILTKYPQAALEQRQQGTVTVIIAVKPDGSVESVEVKTSSGYGTLDRAAIQHVKTRYKFLPISTEEMRYF